MHEHLHECDPDADHHQGEPRAQGRAREGARGARGARGEPPAALGAAVRTTGAPNARGAAAAAQPTGRREAGRQGQWPGQGQVAPPPPPPAPGDARPLSRGPAVRGEPLFQKAPRP